MKKRFSEEQLIGLHGACGVCEKRKNAVNFLTETLAWKADSFWGKVKYLMLSLR